MNDPLRDFETTLRTENERIMPPDDLLNRLQAHPAITEPEHAPPRYRITVARARQWQRARRLILPVAALIAVSVTASVMMKSRSIDPAERPEHIASIPTETVVVQQSAPEVRTTVTVAGPKRAIVRELPTQRDDVTIVWLYDVFPTAPANDDTGEPLGARPDASEHLKGTHS